MKLTVRTLDERVRQTVLQRIHDIAVAQAESFNATATIRHINGSPVLKNNPQANEMVRNVATDLFGQDSVAEVNAFMGSEDFAFMLEKNPNGCYFTLAPAMSRTAAWYITRVTTLTTTFSSPARRCGPH